MTTVLERSLEMPSNQAGECRSDLLISHKVALTVFRPKSNWCSKGMYPILEYLGPFFAATRCESWIVNPNRARFGSSQRNDVVLIFYGFSV